MFGFILLFISGEYYFVIFLSGNLELWLSFDDFLVNFWKIVFFGFCENFG